MMTRLPIRLQNDPIVEAVFELRFAGVGPSVADVLQGALFPPLKDRFPKVVRTAFSAVPEPVVAANPNFRYQPRLQLQGEHGSVFVGDHNIVVASRKPYPGWTEFRALILEVLQHVNGAAVTGETERFSLKYVNVLPVAAGAPASAQFKMVQYSATLGALRLTDLATHTRTQFERAGLTNLVELTANAAIKSPPAIGLLLSVDTICDDAKDFWVTYPAGIEKLHDVEKDIFFEILTSETIEKMGPVWAH